MGLRVYAPRPIAAPVRGAVAALAPPGSAAALGTATTAAIERIAGASGVAAPGAVPVPAGTPSSGDTVAWIVFAVGAALIAVAWALSLRARPLQLTIWKGRT